MIKINGNKKAHNNEANSILKYTRKTSPVFILLKSFVLAIDKNLCKVFVFNLRVIAFFSSHDSKSGE